MPETMPLQPGQSFAQGRFVLVQLLGQGGMGEVWLARDERLNESVALKFLPPEIRGDPAALDDLRRETSRSRKLTHPNIIRIHDLHEEGDGTAFIAMEYVDGPTLAGLRVEQPARVLEWDYLRPLVEQLCAALDYAHGEKVVHRDLKPANVMVDRKGRLKLADFGIAAVASNSMSRVSVKHSTSGTLPYMSPQQVTGKRPQAADDIYALGATLYELLTGKPPFHSGDITHQILHEAPEPMEDRLAALGMQNEIPPDAASLIMACLGKEPGQRPQSARVVAGWIGLELDMKPSAEGIAAALVTQTPARMEKAPVQNGFGNESPSRVEERPILGVWRDAAVEWMKVIVLLVLGAGIFWLCNTKHGIGYYAIKVGASGDFWLWKDNRRDFNSTFPQTHVKIRAVPEGDAVLLVATVGPEAGSYFIDVVDTDHTGVHPLDDLRNDVDVRDADGKVIRPTSGGKPLKFQWLANGNPIPYQNRRYLYLGSLRLVRAPKPPNDLAHVGKVSQANAGLYTVVITPDGGPMVLASVQISVTPGAVTARPAR